MGHEPQHQPEQQVQEPDDRPGGGGEPPRSPTEVAFVGLGQMTTEERLSYGEDEDEGQLEAGEIYHTCRLRPRCGPSRTNP
jgi:hypothetical protein